MLRDLPSSKIRKILFGRVIDSRLSGFHCAAAKPIQKILQTYQEPKIKANLYKLNGIQMSIKLFIFKHQKYFPKPLDELGFVELILTCI